MKLQQTTVILKYSITQHLSEYVEAPLLVQCFLVLLKWILVYQVAICILDFYSLSPPFFNHVGLSIYFTTRYELLAHAVFFCIRGLSSHVSFSPTRMPSILCYRE